MFRELTFAGYGVQMRQHGRLDALREELLSLRPLWGNSGRDANIRVMGRRGMRLCLVRLDREIAQELLGAGAPAMRFGKGAGR